VRCNYCHHDVLTCSPSVLRVYVDLHHDPSACRDALCVVGRKLMRCCVNDCCNAVSRQCRSHRRDALTRPSPFSTCHCLGLHLQCALYDRLTPMLIFELPAAINVNGTTTVVLLLRLCRSLPCRVVAAAVLRWMPPHRDRYAAMRCCTIGLMTHGRGLRYCTTAVRFFGLATCCISTCVACSVPLPDAPGLATAV
jgi:hypothetical protein